MAAAAAFGVVGMTATPQPAHALGTGAAVGLGLGAFALGTAVGANANPYYNGYYYAPGYYSAAGASRPTIRMARGSAGTGLGAATTLASLSVG